MHITGFEWNESNIEHIAKHHVTPQEVEEACYNQPICRRTKDGMSKKNSKIPKFRSDAEAAHFWDTHDSTKYLSETKPAHLAFPKPKHKVVIDLGEKQWRRLIRLASIKRIPYASLLEKFVSEKLSVH